MRRNRGFSLLEVLIAVSIFAAVTSTAVPLAFGSLDQTRTAGAASYIASRLSMARFDALRRSAHVAVRFAPGGTGYSLRTYVDGNGNGVLAADISSGVDSPLGPEERLDDHFPGVTFGIHPDASAIDPASPFDKSDPIQIGPSSLVSFNPVGSCTSGTLFVRGRGASQFAVRLLGATGRTRVLRFNFSNGTWSSR